MKDLLIRRDLLFVLSCTAAMQQEPLLWHSLEFDPLGSFYPAVPTERHFCQISLMKTNTATSLRFHQVLDDTIEWRSVTSQKLKFVNL
mgnify:CR=1 FL=1